MKEFLELIKKLWENKRTRSLVVLLLYFVFFAFVLSSVDNTPQVIKPSGIEIIKNLKIVKMEFLGQHNFIYSDNIIYYDGIYYNSNEIPLELSNYDLNIFTVDNIYELIKNGLLESTNYIDNSNTYVVKNSIFENIIHNNQIDISGNIRITLNESSMNYVNIDLKELYGYEIRIELGS